MASLTGVDGEDPTYGWEENHDPDDGGGGGVDGDDDDGDVWQGLVGIGPNVRSCCQNHLWMASEIPSFSWSGHALAGPR